MPTTPPDHLPRIGHGYDIHRTVPGRRLVLGGIPFDTDFGLDGHSDADCLTHAICDALLGAAGLPDIGHYFPNTDPAWKDIDSQVLLQKTAAAIRERGFEIGNIDASLIAERPKIAPRLTAMRERLAASAGIDAAQIGLKATTNEGADDIGAGRAIAAHAVALLFRP
ncbi:MAG: 2-C-methyl-D-erythritol 2,4-cyclodiphosphate synthase [Verrucomicrobia bacterium]|nr:MAG: 2-C-methyl-D-erythritol 2,4-cyclodiphosphate synthase [Verrucomicrobiota bacterium]